MIETYRDGTTYVNSWAALSEWTDEYCTMYLYSNFVALTLATPQVQGTTKDLYRELELAERLEPAGGCHGFRHRFDWGGGRGGGGRDTEMHERPIRIHSKAYYHRTALFPGKVKKNHELESWNL